MAVAFFLALAEMAMADPDPPGPRLALVSDAPREFSRLITVGPGGEDPQVLVDDPDYWGIGEALSWSADGELVAFMVSGPFQADPGGAFGVGWPLAAVASADGGSRPYARAFLNAGEPIMAPDGSSVAFQRVKLVKVLPGRENYLFKSTILSIDLDDGSVRRLTRWRLGRFLEPSGFSPDGSKLAATLTDRRGFSAVAIRVHSGRVSMLARDALKPVYSPNGKRLAMVRLGMRYRKLPKPNRRVSELLVARADGSRSRRLLRRRGSFTRPSWDPSGARLTFTRNFANRYGEIGTKRGNKVMAINADGSCLTRVFADPNLAVSGVAWRPGAGRGAGRINCRSMR